jgi:predicted outer membrane repeat protein
VSKMKHASLLSGALLIVSLTSPRASVADPVTHYVGFGIHDVGGSCEDPDYVVNGSSDNVELQAAVDGANDGDTIVLCEGTYLLTDEVELDIDLEIVGVGVDKTVLDGQSVTRLFNSTADLTLKHATLQNGNTVTMNNCMNPEWNDGGAICVNGVATLVSTIFKDNVSGEYGGAVAAGEVRIFDSTFENNSSEGPGGAVVTEELNGASSIVKDSLFVENFALGDGGAISTERDRLSVLNSEFVRNVSTDDGGAIATWNPVVTDFRRNVFKMNVASDLGGALYVRGTRQGGRIKIVNRFIRNEAGRTSARDVYFQP